MLRIIDSTLALLDNYEVTKEQLHQFCNYMKKIGIIDLEISKKMYRRMEEIPESFRFYVYLDLLDEYTEFKNAYKFIYHNVAEASIIGQAQINDIREILQLKKYDQQKHIRIIGLDDLMCYNYAYYMNEINSILSHSKINFCPENTFYCATALAVQWAINGGSELTTSFAGVGNRAATEEVLIALRVHKRYKVNQDLTSLVSLKELFEEITNQELPLMKPVIGNEIFYVETGIHVDGIMKKASNYEPYLPEIVGKTMKIIIGKHSSKGSLRTKMENLGIEWKDFELDKILEKVKEKSIKKKSCLIDEELVSLISEVIKNEA